MPAKEVTTRNRLATIAGTLAPATIKTVAKGLVDLGVSTEFFKNSANLLPYLQIRPAVRKARTRLETQYVGGFSIESRLYFSFAKDASEDFTAIEEIVFATLMAGKWESAALYTDCAPPDEIDEIGEPEIITDTRMIGLYRIKMHFRSC